MMIIQGIIEFGYNICSIWFLDIKISTFFIELLFNIVKYYCEKAVIAKLAIYIGSAPEESQNPMGYLEYLNVNI